MHTYTYMLNYVCVYIKSFVNWKFQCAKRFFFFFCGHESPKTKHLKEKKNNKIQGFFFLLLDWANMML